MTETADPDRSDATPAPRPAPGTAPGTSPGTSPRTSPASEPGAWPVETRGITARDGTPLALHAAGPADGRPLILLHGLFSSAHVNWVKFGTAAMLAAAGHRLWMPDLRAHGQSGAPHDPAAYPSDVLADDLADLVEALGLEPGGYDLGGFSLGARTAARGVIGGLAPARLMLIGMGLEGLAGWARRREFFQRAIAAADTARRGDDVWMAIQFLKTMKVDTVAASLLLDTLADTDPAALSAVTMPTLVLCGADDRDNGDPDALAAALPDARAVAIPGTHMSSVTEPAMGRAMVAFLDDR